MILVTSVNEERHMRGIVLFLLSLLWVLNVYGHIQGHIVPWIAYCVSAILSLVAIVVWRRVK